MIAVRLMGECRMGTEGFAVCTGVVASPRRRCLWTVVAKRRRGPAAVRIMDSLPARDGRAVFHLDARCLVIVNRKGDVIQDNRKPLRVMRLRGYANAQRIKK